MDNPKDKQKGIIISKHMKLLEDIKCGLTNDGNSTEELNNSINVEDTQGEVAKLTDVSEIVSKSAQIDNPDEVISDEVVSQNTNEIKAESEEKESQEATNPEDTDSENEKSVVISEPTEAMMEEMMQDDAETASNITTGRKVMAFWKRGGMHVQDRTRCQDTAFCIGYDEKDSLYSKYAENHNKIKVVMDGCGSCEYSLLGVLMFEEEFKRKASEIQISPDNLEDVIKEIFQKMLRFGNSVNFILDNFLFTILICFEYDDHFDVCTCGDGFILFMRNGQLYFKELEGSEKNEQGKVLPNYFAYDLEEVKGKLSNYKDGTEFELYTFDKETYSDVGVSSDGIRFFSRLNDEAKSELFSMIYYRMPNGVERLLNEHKGIFMDDFSVAF